MTCTILTLIQLLHILYILFVVITPFTNNIFFLSMHLIFIPFMMLHWICNENTCALTLMEQTMRYKMYGTTDKNMCFTAKLIEPVYDFKKNHDEFSTAIYLLTIILWLITVRNLYNKYKNNELGEYTSVLKKLKLI